LQNLLEGGFVVVEEAISRRHFVVAAARRRDARRRSVAKIREQSLKPFIEPSIVEVCRLHLFLRPRSHRVTPLTRIPRRPASPGLAARRSMRDPGQTTKIKLKKCRTTRPSAWVIRTKVTRA